MAKLGLVLISCRVVACTERCAVVKSVISQISIQSYGRGSAAVRQTLRNKLSKRGSWRHRLMCGVVRARVHCIQAA